MGKLKRELESWGGAGGSGSLLLWVTGYTPLIQEPPKYSWGPCTLNPIT